jgi:hypothetical protein
MSNESKARTLGMPHGTASNRLRKILLFHQLKKHGENICVRCWKLIESVDDLSIEHLKPWEGISADLFWDLNNVRYSHLYCNRPHRFNQNAVPPPPQHTRTKEAPEGTAWCTGHKDYLLVEAFHSNERNVNKVASYCKECRKIRLD